MNLTGTGDKLDINALRKISESLPKHIGLITHILANIWLFVPFMTILLFTLMSGYLKGNMIHFLQIFYGVLTICISFYFVDKNAHQSKSSAILSAIHNALLLFSIIMFVIEYNPCTKCIPVHALNAVHFTIMLIGFNILVTLSNKNSSSKSSIIGIIGLLLIHVLRIYLTVK